MCVWSCCDAALMAGMVWIQMCRLMARLIVLVWVHLVTCMWNHFCFTPSWLASLKQAVDQMVQEFNLLTFRSTASLLIALSIVVVVAGAVTPC